MKLEAPEKMISDIEDYFAKGCGRCVRFDTVECSTRRWTDGLAKLRGLCCGAALKETVKWGQPCYMHAGRNIAIIGALRADFSLSFFNAALMTDPIGVLRRSGPNTRHPDTIRFAATDEVFALAQVVRAYLEEAKSYAERGLKPPKENDALDLPKELVEALASDPELDKAFRRLTRGRQRSYVINLNGARQSETRMRRIARFRNRIIAGKGANEP